MARKSEKPNIIFRRNWIGTLKRVAERESTEALGILLLAIYAELDGEELPAMSPYLMGVFDMLIEDIKNEHADYAKACEGKAKGANVANAKKSANATNATNAKDSANATNTSQVNTSQVNTSQVNTSVIDNSSLERLNTREQDEILSIFGGVDE